MSMKVHPGTEEEIHLVRACAGPQACDFTRAELADDTKRGGEIGRALSALLLRWHPGDVIVARSSLSMTTSPLSMKDV
jgi:hypothetical protein